MELKHLAALTAALASVGGGSAMASGVVRPVAASGRTELTEFLLNQPVSVAILTHEVPIKPSEPPRIRTDSCTYSRVPCAVVDGVDLSVRGRAVAVPRSVFADLADLNTARLEPAGHGRYRLVLAGGDAAESYRAAIVFDDRRVLTRAITATEAGMVEERTVYSDVSKAFR